MIPMTAMQLVMCLAAAVSVGMAITALIAAIGSKRLRSFCKLNQQIIEKQTYTLQAQRDTIDIQRNNIDLLMDLYLNLLDNETPGDIYLKLGYLATSIELYMIDRHLFYDRDDLKAIIHSDISGAETRSMYSILKRYYQSVGTEDDIRRLRSWRSEIERLQKRRNEDLIHQKNARETVMVTMGDCGFHVSKDALSDGDLKPLWGSARTKPQEHLDKDQALERMIQIVREWDDCLNNAEGESTDETEKTVCGDPSSEAVETSPKSETTEAL